jgi:hypothetical protein
LSDFVIEQIEEEFPFFPRLHAILAARPNVIPITVTTGMGPNGRKTVYYQPPDNRDSSSGNQDGTDVEIAGLETQKQYSTLMDAIAAAGAQCTPPGTPFSSEPHSTPWHQTPRRSVPLSPTALRARSIADKENTAPAGQQVRKSMSLASELLEKARASIKKNPPKPTLEETLIQVQRYYIASIKL